MIPKRALKRKTVVEGLTDRMGVRYRGGGLVCTSFRGVYADLKLG
jgi:hypothetical protein